MSLTNEQIIEAIGQKTVLEVVELIKAMEEKFGVTAAAATVAAAGPAAAAVEEQTEFNVVLADAGEKKVNVIKAVRELTGLGLKEAKEKVDTAPQVIAEGLSKEAAEDAKTSAHPAHWAYGGEGGPSHWGQLAPENSQCATGAQHVAR